MTGEEVFVEVFNSATNGMVISNFAASFVFNASMQMMWGSINSLSIVAHMPLNNIYLPANSYFIFDLLIQVVSFDFLPIFDYTEAWWTPTEPWNANFGWLGYETLTFTLNMGSLLLIFWWILISIMISCCAKS